MYIPIRTPSAELRRKFCREVLSKHKIPACLFEYDENPYVKYHGKVVYGPNFLDVPALEELRKSIEMFISCHAIAELYEGAMRDDKERLELEDEIDSQN